MPTPATNPRLDIAAVRADFPILAETVHGKPLTYLDNGATSQKPEAVLRALDDYYRHYNANVHRGVYQISERATTAYEEARHKVARFIGATDDREIVFVRGTTEGINLVARSWGGTNLAAGAPAAASGAAASASPSAAMIAIGSPILTVAPSSAVISRSTPDTGEGISVLTLSVVTSTSGSYCSTCSPGRFSQRPIVPSLTLSPRWGIVMCAIAYSTLLKDER